MRRASPNEDEADVRLRRQIQGLLNKLSEAKLISILGDVTRLYQNNPRQSVTSTLIDLLLGLVTDPAALSDTFIVLHAGFIAAIHKTLGLDFSAQLVEEAVRQFDGCFNQAQSETENGKQCNNLVTLLAQMYNFQVIGSTLIFDYIRELLQSLSELHTELLLRVVRSKFPSSSLINISINSILSLRH